jgi:hypothetical protein
MGETSSIAAASRLEMEMTPGCAGRKLARKLQEKFAPRRSQLSSLRFVQWTNLNCQAAIAARFPKRNWGAQARFDGLAGAVLKNFCSFISTRFHPTFSAKLLLNQLIRVIQVTLLNLNPTLIPTSYYLRVFFILNQKVTSHVSAVV